MIPFPLTPVRVACILLATAAVPAAAQTAAPAAPQPAASAPTQTLDQVVVVGFRKSLRSAEEIKRDATQVVDSINAADIGAFPDRSIGDALQRVAGVQITRDLGETANVIIRGLPDVSTTVNGMEVFTGTGRRIAYQDLPVQAVQGLDVYKSLTADILEGGIAGSVNVRLTAPFDRTGFGAGLNLDAQRPQVHGSSATKEKTNPAVGGFVRNTWNTGAGQFGALVDVYYQKTDFAYPVQWVDKPDLVWSVNPTTGNATRLGPYGDPNIVFRPANPGERLATSSHIGGIYNAGERERGSLHAALQWKPDARWEFSGHLLSTQYKARRETDYIFSITGWTPTATNVVISPEGPGCFPNRAAGEPPICNVLSSTNPRAIFGPENWQTDPYVATSTWGIDEESRMHMVTAGGTYRSGALRIKTDAAYTTSKHDHERIIVDQQVLQASSQTYAVGPDGHGGFTSVTTPTSQNALRDPAQFGLRGLVQNWFVNEGTQLQLRSDAEWTLGGGLVSKVLAGVRYSDRNAQAQSEDRFFDSPSSRPNPVATFGADFNRLVPGVDRLLGPFQTPNADFLIDKADTVRAFYGAPQGRLPANPMRGFEQDEKTTTVYGMARLGFDVGSVTVQADAGVRLVNVKRDLRGFNSVGGTVSPFHIEASENNVLPSISGTISWSERLQSHFSAGRTITRPDFAQLNPSMSLIPPTQNMQGTGSAGNANLKPTKSDSIDATLEYYFKKNGYVQAALFDRRLDGRVQGLVRNETIGGVNYEVSRPYNSRKGRLYGVELGGQTFFDFLPAPFDGIGVQANYTLINGWNEAPVGPNGAFVRGKITDVSKHNYNLVLMYQGFGLQARLAATRRGEYVEQLSEPPFNLDNTVRAATYVDFGLGYELTKQLTLQFDATNITKTKYRSFIGHPSRPRDIRYTPSSYSLGLRITL
jgi:TonB-dependent receptor